MQYKCQLLKSESMLNVLHLYEQSWVQKRLLTQAAIVKWMLCIEQLLFIDLVVGLQEKRTEV